jgi:hypothetical protein
MNGWNTYPHSNSRHSGMLLALGLHVLLISAWWQMQHQPWRSHNSTSSAMELVFVAPPQPVPQAAPQTPVVSQPVAAEPVRASSTPPAPVSAKRRNRNFPQNNKRIRQSACGDTRRQHARHGQPASRTRNSSHTAQRP